MKLNSLNIETTHFQNAQQLAKKWLNRDVFLKLSAAVYCNLWQNLIDNHSI
jgi:hypothetical protein